VEIKND